MKVSELNPIPFTTCLRISKTGDWRALRPVVDNSKCKKCGLCYLYCPDGAITQHEDGIEINYDFCKGCGICANECRAGAITMVREEEEW